jgi:hypothetical protein
VGEDLSGQLLLVIQFQKCRITVSAHKSEEVKVIHPCALLACGVTGVSGSNVGDMFIWMPKEHLYVLVYLVTVMHSMQAGYMDKAQKYTDKALMQIEKLKSTFIHPDWQRCQSVWVCHLLNFLFVC